MSFKSCAQWPKGTFDGLGNYTEDKHDTREQADAVCRLLEQRGAGGDGVSFPVKTWVQPIIPDAEHTEASLASQVFDPAISDLAYFHIRGRCFGLVDYGHN